MLNKQIFILIRQRKSFHHDITKNKYALRRSLGIDGTLSPLMMIKLANYTVLRLNNQWRSEKVLKIPLANTTSFTKNNTSFTESKLFELVNK